MLRSPFLRRLTTLLGGTIGGQVIALIAAPFVARLYAPAEFGVLGVYMSVLGIIVAVSMLRYECALPVAKDGDDAANLLCLCLLFGAGTSVLAFGIFGCASKTITKLLRVELIQNYLWILPIGIAATATYTALISWGIRRQDYRLIARTKVTQVAGMVTAQIGGGLLRYGPAGLILGQIVGQSGGIGSMARSLIRSDGALLRRVSWKGVARAAREFSRFPKYSTTAVLLESLTGTLPYLFLAAYYGATVVGWFTFTQRYFFVPANLLATSTSQVLFGEFAEHRRTSGAGLRGLFLRRLRVSAALGGAVLMIVWFVIPPIIPRVFGAIWVPAATCLRLMAPALCAGLIASPYGCALDVLGRQDLHLVRELARTLLVGTALILARVSGGDWKMALTYLSWALVLCSVVYLGMSWLAINGRTRLNEAGAGRSMLLVRRKFLVYESCRQPGMAPLPDTPSVNITSATEESVARFFGDDKSLKRRFKRFLDEGHAGVILFDEDRWLAYGWMTRPGGVPPHLPRAIGGCRRNWIFFCHTREEWRGRGFYKYVLQSLREQAVPGGATGAVLIDTDAANVASIQAILKSGFEPRGVVSVSSVGVPRLWRYPLWGKWAVAGQHSSVSAKES